MQKKKSNSLHPSTSNVFEDLGFTPEEAAVLRLKTELHIALIKQVKSQKITPRKLQELLDIPQPRVSELLNGKISKMSVDKLTKYLHRLGREVKVTIKKANKLQGTEVA